eukprot:3919995-Heterocapsa_arctica.AAC.1
MSSNFWVHCPSEAVERAIMSVGETSTASSVSSCTLWAASGCVISMRMESSWQYVLWSPTSAVRCFKRSLTIKMDILAAQAPSSLMLPA